VAVRHAEIVGATHGEFIAGVRPTTPSVGIETDRATNVSPVTAGEQIAIVDVAIDIQSLTLVDVRASPVEDVDVVPPLPVVLMNVGPS